MLDETITITTPQATRILELLEVCDDLLRNGTEQVRVDLARSMTMCGVEPVDVAWFIDMVGFTGRHLHAQIDHHHRQTTQTGPRP